MDLTNLHALKRRKERALEKNDMKILQNVCSALGDIFFSQGNFEGALQEFQTLCFASEALNDTSNVGFANRVIGECYAELENFEQALIYQRKHLEISQSSRDSVEEQRAWATIGRTFLLQAGSFQEEDQNKIVETISNAEDAFMKSLDLCTRISDLVTQRELMEMKARLYLNLGIAHDHKKDLLKCRDLIEKAIEINRTYGLREDLHRCYLALINIYQSHNSFNEALHFCSEAVLCSEKLQNMNLQCETLMVHAQILMKIRDFRGAKLCLKKAYKLKIPLQLKIEIKRYLKSVYILSETENSLLHCKEDEANEKLLLYEKMGDECSKIGCFNEALGYYHKMLECSEKLNMSENEKNPIYSSIAQTYFDMQLYNKAEEYFQKELMNRSGEYEEECQSLINIADCKILQGCQYEDVKFIYDDALDRAKKSSDMKIQKLCLNALFQLQEKFNLHEEKEEITKQLESLGCLSENESNDDENVTDTSLDISDDTDSEMKHEQHSSRQRINKKRLLIKRNEKGETRLHVACINGNLKEVKRLVNLGHPVNIRDNSGWLPLHEASNHGYYEITKYLLDNGASVNDRGGSCCDGITPLHDAASCGHIDIMRLLIEKGASVVAKTNDGATPLESLIQWRQRTDSDDQILLDEYADMVKLLKNSIEKVGHSIPSVSVDLNNKINYDEGQTDNNFSSSDENEGSDKSDTGILNKQFPRKRSFMESEFEEEFGTTPNSFKKRQLIDKTNFNMDDNECSKFTNSFATRSNIDDPIRAKNQYINVISSLRNANSSRIYQEKDQNVNSQNPIVESKTALIDEDQIVDDWLENDVKSKFTTKSCSRTSFSIIHTKVNKNNSSLSRFNIQREKRCFRRKPKLLQQKLEILKVNKNLGNSYSTSSEVLENSSKNNDDDLRIELPKVIENIQTISLRVKIRIGDKLLLVPVAESDLEKSVNWLAEEAAKRYCNINNGQKPILNLMTSDGAFLIPEDAVNLVVNGDEELIGKVEHWEVYPLHERYVEACHSMNSSIFNNIKSILEESLTSRSLKLKDLSLTFDAVQPMFQVLQCQYSLKYLCFSGNCFGDKGMKELMNVIFVLPNLVTLNLSCTNITAQGIQHFNKIFISTNDTTNESVPLQELAELDLSHNPLGDKCSKNLSIIIENLKSLSSLNLSSCLLTSELFIAHNNAFSRSLKSAKKLQKINLSSNKINALGIKMLFEHITIDRITDIDISSTLSSSNEHSHIVHCIFTYLSQNHCALEKLKLGDLYLTDECIFKIIRSLSSHSNLNELNLERNFDLSFKSIENITNHLRNNCLIRSLCIDISECLFLHDEMKSINHEEHAATILQLWTRYFHLETYEHKLQWNSQTKLETDKESHK